MRIPLTEAALEALPEGTIVIPITNTPMPYAFYSAEDRSDFLDLGREGHLRTTEVIELCRGITEDGELLQIWPVEVTDYATLLNRLEAVEAKLDYQLTLNAAVQDQMHDESLRRQDAELLIRNQVNQLDQSMTAAINTAVSQQQVDQARVNGRLDYVESVLKERRQ